jgi:hypothetical protein
MANEKPVQAQPEIAAKPGRNLNEFASFAKKAVRMPRQSNSYRNIYSRGYSRMSNEFSKEEIR